MITLRILRHSATRLSSTATSSSSSFVAPIVGSTLGISTPEVGVKTTITQAKKTTTTPTTTTPTTTSQYYFSSASSEATKIACPPNLKFHPKAYSSPFYGLDTIEEQQDSDSSNLQEEQDEGLEQQEQQVDFETNTVEEVAVAAATSTADNDDEEEEEEEGIIYDLTKKPQPIYAIPLPERLHVPINHLSTNLTNPNPSSSTTIEQVGSIHLPPHLFGRDPIRTDILHRCIVYQRNKKRGRRNAGARTKTVSEVSGSGRKVRPQKGQGTARAGHSRPAHWRGGAKAHGPKGAIQNYETKLNKKVRKMGLTMALSQKLKEGNLILVNDWGFIDTFKTKVLSSVLDELGDVGGRYGCNALLVDHIPREIQLQEVDEDEALTHLEGCHVNLKVASRNLHQVKVLNQLHLNVYDLLKHEKLVMSLSALEALEERMPVPH